MHALADTRQSTYRRIFGTYSSVSCFELSLCQFAFKFRPLGACVKIYLLKLQYNSTIGKRQVRGPRKGVFLLFLARSSCLQTETRATPLLCLLQLALCDKNGQNRLAYEPF